MSTISLMFKTVKDTKAYHCCASATGWGSEGEYDNTGAFQELIV